ncbi:MAG TPA: BlaI/MecI/CopY family transcriptional regulator [Gemmatimonadales bacterium]|nr:BlaI/MecI/CopY family transcriptional regulator [Gemmatimonadales bacterium]
MPQPAAPTPAELQLLRILWSRGPSTVREVHDALAAGTETGYTTTLKLMQNLHAKHLVKRDDSHRQHVYTAAVKEGDTLQGVVRGLIDRAFEGSAAALAMHALEAKPASAEELADLKELIRRLERQGGR